MAADTFPHIRAAAIDQRTENIFYRQTQLERLTQSLISTTNDISSAIAADYGNSQAEVAIEINLAISAVRRDYASLQPKQAHEDEYLIAAGKDAPSTRKPAGIVYIEPCTHTLFYSVIVPLSAAIAAGNCVIVLLESTLRVGNLSSLLRQILTSALDRDTFAVASSPIEEQQLLESMIQVNQNGCNDRWPRANQLSSPASSRTIAVVDRTADVEIAARELLAARFSFGGRSPYAPDIIFVNEFTKRRFLQAVVSEHVKLGGGVLLNSGSTSKTKAGDSSKVTDKLNSLRKADPTLRIILLEPDYAVVEVTSRDTSLLASKHPTPILIVHAVRSLDDAIDLISSTCPSHQPTNLAAYHFSNAASGKYLSQFIDAYVSFINEIPRELLLGPACPAGHPIDPINRYPAKLFTVPRPSFIKPAFSSKVLNAALSSADNPTAQRLLAEATTPLKVMKRSAGGGVGFFEQGFLMNAGLILTTTISLASVGAWWLARYGRSLW